MSQSIQKIKMKNKRCKVYHLSYLYLFEKLLDLAVLNLIDSLDVFLSKEGDCDPNSLSLLFLLLILFVLNPLYSFVFPLF